MIRSSSIRDHAVIAETPAPEPGMFAGQRAAGRAGVVERGDALFERLDDPRRDLSVEERQADLPTVVPVG